MNHEPMNTPLNHPQTIHIGQATVPYGPRNVGWSTMNVYHLPGMRITTSRDHAHSVAVRMDKLMMGAK